MQNCRAFTLIELLVVIAIIAILAAILFPVFAQAKAAAKKTTDASNLKQIALGILMYNGDNDDLFPRGNYPNPQDPSYWYSWREASSPYIKSGQQEYAPGIPLVKGSLWASPSEPSGALYGYGAHDGLMPGEEHWMAPGVKTASHSPTQLERGAETLMISTIGINPAWNSGSSLGVETLHWTYNDWSWPIQWLSDGAARYEGDNRDTDGKIGWKLVRYRYTDSANVAWVDGHAKAVKKGALDWCKNLYTSGFSSVGGANDDWLWSQGNACYGK
ncbi:prepilin-type N-terminal cleavage/methylation domain-containing protein [bacterium]|nr:MAG: prepilin-type N-terminal cleavage/methylation domain-containing protein [bacterium]